MKSKAFLKYSLAVLMASSALCPAAVRAQSVDYNGLQMLYGEPITTSANGSPQRESDVPLNMEIITSEDIERMGARSLTEIMRFVPGVSVNQHTFGQSEVSVRGYNQYTAERILVLVDGRHVYNDIFGQNIWDNIPVEIAEIKQIEIVKGPNTALFGFNAVSGVVNIITINPLYEELRTAEVRVGNHDFNEQSAVMTTRLNDNIAAKFSAGAYKTNDAYDQVADSSFDKPYRRSMALDVWAQVNDHVQANFAVTTNNSGRNEFLNNQNGATYSAVETNSVRGRILADTDIGLVDFDVYHNAAEGQVNATTTGGTQQELTPDNRVTVVKLSDTFSMQDHIFRLNGEYRTASNIIPETDGDDLTYDIWSASGLWDWAVNDKVRTSVGVRYDFLDIEPDGNVVNPTASSNALISPLLPYSEEDYYQEHEALSYNVGLVYKPTYVDTLRFSAARGVDLPSFLELTTQFLVTPSATNQNVQWVFGNPTISLATVDNYEIGYDRNLPEINGKLRTAIFYQYNNEMQALGADTDVQSVNTGAPFFLTLTTNQTFFGNIGDSEMYGAEIGLEGVYKQKWDWFVNYAYVIVDDHLRNQQDPTYEYTSPIEYEESNIDHVINGHVGYRADDWYTGVYVQYRSSAQALTRGPSGTNTDYYLTEVDDQIIVNANFAYDWSDSTTWSISGTSLLGSTQQGSNSEAAATLWTGLKVKF